MEPSTPPAVLIDGVEYVPAPNLDELVQVQITFRMPDQFWIGQMSRASRDSLLAAFRRSTGADRWTGEAGERVLMLTFADVLYIC